MSANVSTWIKKSFMHLAPFFMPVTKAVQSYNKALKPIWKWQYQRLKSVSKMLSGYTKLKTGHFNIIIELTLNEKKTIKSKTREQYNFIDTFLLVCYWEFMETVCSMDLKA